MSGLLEPLFESTTYQVLFWMFVTVVAAAVVVYLFERRFRRRTKEEAERLFELARRLNCSEFDIFQTSGQKWSIPDKRVKRDFKRYLHYGEIPFYVRDYLRAAHRTE